jgi:beta-galactosidase
MRLQSGISIQGVGGIGSNSCGPELLQAYRFDDKAFTFELTVRPVFVEDE